MNAKDSQELIASKLREALEKGFPERIHLCEPDSAPPPGGFIMPVSRLDAILSGEKRVELRLAEGPRKLTLKAGEAYMAPPGAWELHSWDSVCEMLCVVPQKSFLRVSYYKQDDPARRPEALFHHTMRLSPEPLLATVSLLNRRDVGDGNPEAARHLGRALLCLALAECELPAAPASGKGAALFERVRDWLEDNYQEDVSLAGVAEAFGVGPDYLVKLFKRHAGHGLHEHLNSIRMELARYLLSSTELDLKRISQQCGFKSCVHFTRRFRELNGLPPGRYRQAAKAC